MSTAVFLWRGEVLPIDPARVDEAGHHFDEIVGRIQAKHLTILQPPEARICRECDLRPLCTAEGLLPRTHT